MRIHKPSADVLMMASGISLMYSLVETWIARAHYITNEDFVQPLLDTDETTPGPTSNLLSASGLTCFLQGVNPAHCPPG